MRETKSIASDLADALDELEWDKAANELRRLEDTLKIEIKTARETLEEVDRDRRQFQLRIEELEAENNRWQDANNKRIDKLVDDLEREEKISEQYFRIKELEEQLKNVV